MQYIKKNYPVMNWPLTSFMVGYVILPAKLSKAWDVIEELIKKNIRTINMYIKNCKGYDDILRSKYQLCDVNLLGDILASSLTELCLTIFHE